jgi:putative hemolysin
MNTAFTLPLFLVLLLLTAFFNLAEMALVAARQPALEGAAKSGGAAEAALALKKRLGLFLAAIRAGDLLTDLIIGAYVVTWLEGLLRDQLVGLPAVAAYAPLIGGAAAFVVISYATLVFADLVPKSVALAAPERIAMLIARPLQLLIVTARPFLFILEESSNLVLKLFRVRSRGEEIITQEEIRRVLSEGLHSGALLSAERSMMDRVLDLDRRTIRTVMTSRREVRFLTADMQGERLSSHLLDCQASRLPVMMTLDPDTILGTVTRADVLAVLRTNETVDLAAMAAPVIFVSESASVLGVLETMKVAHVHMVAITDEFGSVVGIATMADIFEAVAGEIGPSASTVRAPHEQRTSEADGSYLIDASEPADEIAEEFGLRDIVGPDYKTMAGLVTERLRRLPAEGDTIDLQSLRIEVVSVKRGRVETLRITRQTDPTLPAVG